MFIDDPEVRFSTDDPQQMTEALKELNNTTPVGKQYFENCYTPERADEHYDLLVESAVQVAGDTNASLNDLQQALFLLMKSKRIQEKGFKRSAPIEEPAAAKRDKLGRQRTSAQDRYD